MRIWYLYGVYSQELLGSFHIRTVTCSWLACSIGDLDVMLFQLREGSRLDVFWPRIQKRLEFEKKYIKTLYNDLQTLICLQWVEHVKKFRYLMLKGIRFCYFSINIHWTTFWIRIVDCILFPDQQWKVSKARCQNPWFDQHLERKSAGPLFCDSNLKGNSFYK